MDKIDADYFDGNLDAAIYNQHKKGLLTNKMKLDLELERYKANSVSYPQLDNDAILNLCNLEVVYKRSSSKTKRTIVKSLFPKGFTINK